MARQISASDNCRVFLVGVAGFLSAALIFMFAGSDAWLDGTVYQPQIRQDDYESMELDRINGRHNNMPTVYHYQAVSGVGDGEIKVEGATALRDDKAIPHTGLQKSGQPRLCTPIPKPRTTKDTPSGVKIIILA